MNPVEMAGKLYECRNAAKTLLGANYKQDMASWAVAIKAVAEKDKSSELAAANKMAKEVGGFGAVVILAACVEMIEPIEPSR